ncbi:hypothetical protein [Falsiroseomonas sp.]|uniref:major capsid protein n=1 Tax=Falsiroseomonas sp. TaxID=2870721 RepID=UPI003F70BAB8
MATTAFPVNPELTAIAIGYRNRDVDLIADRVLPRVTTAKRFNYRRYPAGEAYTVPSTRVGRKSDPTMVDFSGTDATDECIDYGLDDMIPNDEQEAWNSMPKAPGAVSPMAKSTSLLTGLILLDREIRVANTVFAQATYPSTNRTVLSGASQWSDFTNANPLDAMLAALDIPIFRPNVAVFGQATWTKVRQHPRVIQAVYGTAQTGGAISKDQMAALLEVREVVVGAGFVNTARRGQTPTISRVWGKHAAFLYVSEEQAAADQPTFGFTAQWGSRIAGSIAAPRAGLRGSEIVRVGESVKEVIAAADSGYYFENAVA